MISRIGNNPGFTLIEAMAATAVLSLGIVLIYEAFFISLDAFNYYDDYMKTVSWVDNKIWQAEDNIARTGSLREMDRGGSFTIDNSGFNWKLSYDPVGGMDKLYKVNVILWADRGKRPVTISRTAYAVYKEME